MLLEPLVGFLFDGCNLRAGETCGDKRRESLAGIVAIGAGENHPEVSSIEILGNHAAGEKDGSQSGLRDDVALLGRTGKPANGLALIEFHAIAGSKAPAENILGASITIFCHLAKLIDGGVIA